MFSLDFIKRLAEDAGAAFVAGFSTTVLNGGAFTHSILVGGLTAGGMAVLGVLRKNLGDDPQRPTIK